MKLIAFYKRKDDGTSYIVNCKIVIRIDRTQSYWSLRPFLVEDTRGYSIFDTNKKRTRFKDFEAARMALSLMVSRLT